MIFVVVILWGAGIKAKVKSVIKDTFTHPYVFLFHTHTCCLWNLKSLRQNSRNTITSPQLDPCTPQAAILQLPGEVSPPWRGQYCSRKMVVWTCPSPTEISLHLSQPEDKGLVRLGEKIILFFVVVVCMRVCFLSSQFSSVSADILDITALWAWRLEHLQVAKQQWK